MIELQRWSLCGESGLTLRDNMTGTYITASPGQQEAVKDFYETLLFECPVFEAEVLGIGEPEEEL